MTNNVLAHQGAAVKRAATVLAQAPDAQRRGAVAAVADLLAASGDELLAINAHEVAAFGDAGPGRDRLTLTASRVEDMRRALFAIAATADPLCESVDARTLANGLRVERVRVPLGVVGVVYENRPNVTCDVAALCVRSGNAAYLRGSSSAMATNAFIVKLWREALTREGLDPNGVTLVADPSHETAVSFMQLTDVLDCLIPRGGPRLIAAMREHARVPYVLDGDGNCHVYVDAAADLDMAVAIVANAKASRPGVCNAAETLIVHDNVAEEFLPALERALPGVELRADERAQRYLINSVPASDSDFANEFLDMILAVRVVDTFDDAVEHVARYGTGHSEAIVTESRENADAWVRRVDAAAVLVNASTRFVDGGELGLGAEVGISTQKLHARGPMGVRELTCLKWVIRGEGQIR